MRKFISLILLASIALTGCTLCPSHQHYDSGADKMMDEYAGK